MYKLCKLHKWACLMILLSLTLCAFPGSADTQAPSGDSVSSSIPEDSELARLREEIDRLRAEVERTDAQIAVEKEQTGGAIRQKALMDQQIYLLSAEIACFDLMLERYDDLLTSAETEYNELSLSYDTHFKVLLERLRQSREEGAPDQLEVLRGSKNLLDMLVGLERLKEVEQFDQRLMASLEQEQTRMTELSIRMEDYRYNRHQTALEQIERKQLFNLRLQESGNYLHSLMGDIDRFSFYIQQNQAGKQIADRTIADRVNELLKKISEEGTDFLKAEKEAKLQEVGTAVRDEMESGGIQKGGEYYEDGAAFIWPLAILSDRPASVLSHIGFRTYQVGGKLFTSYHSGVDLAADYGSRVLAAASGKVVSAEYADGYGNYIVILHDDGSQTRYAYLGNILVSVGEYVLQGEVIATSGVSGNSSGIGCHFEMTVNGINVDPLQYLTVPSASDQGAKEE